MTPTRLVLAVSAALAIATAAYAQGTDYANRPLVAEVAPAGAGQTHAQIAAETSCATLLGWYHTVHNVWRGGVKKNREPADQLDLMREILRRKGWLERAGRCGG